MSRDLLKEAERSEIRRRRKQATRQRRRELWWHWVAWWENLAKHLKVAATIVASATGIATAIPAVLHYGPIVKHGVRRAWAFLHARDTPPAELPATGQPTTAIDFVDPPKPVDKP